MKRTTVCAIGLAALLPAFASGQHGDHATSAVARQRCIDEGMAFLKNKSPADFTREIQFYEVVLGNTSALGCRVYDSGYLRLNDNEWICIVTHSAHQDPEIGDVILAMDQQGEFHISANHVCGGIAHFQGKSLVAPTNNARFFAEFEGYAKDGQWHSLPAPPLVPSGH
jgi:hypothetical protein